MNQLIIDFARQGKYIGAVCYGVSVLAWARIDETSETSFIDGRTVVAWSGSDPGFQIGDQHFPDGTVPTRLQIEANGATMLISASVGDPLAFEDDVIVDGNIITAENFLSTQLFGAVLANAIKESQLTR